jgi:hypothetical protein
MLCEEVGFHLAQKCFWYNLRASESGQVNVRRMRVGLVVRLLALENRAEADNEVLAEYSRHEAAARPRLSGEGTAEQP